MPAVQPEPLPRTALNALSRDVTRLLRREPRRLVAVLVGVLTISAPAAVLAQGFPNVSQTPGALLSGLNAPQQGRTAIIAYRVREQISVDGEQVELDAYDSSAWHRRDGRWMCVLHTESIAGDPYGRDRIA